MVFMMIRALFHNQVSWDIEEDDKWELTDAIVNNGEQIDLFQQVFTPAMISLCLLFTPWFSPYIEKDEHSVQTMLHVFAIC